jgi:hypothetical protein
VYGDDTELTATNVDDEKETPAPFEPGRVDGLAYFVPKPLEENG